MCLDLEMVLAVGFVAMVALEGKEIDELTGLLCALFSNGEQLSVALWGGCCAGCGGGH